MKTSFPTHPLILNPHRISESVFPKYRAAPRTRILAFGLAATVLLGLAAAPAGAADRFWINAAGGSFHTPTNWTGGLPGADDLAIFFLAETYTVTFFPSDASTDRLLVSNGDVAFDLGSALLPRTFALTNTTSSTSPSAAASIIIGNLSGDNARLGISTPGLLSGYQTRIGNQAGSVGELSVSNGLAQVNLLGNLSVGFAGTGELNVTGGATVNSQSGTIGQNATGVGAATLAGAGSTWTNSGSLTVGSAGSGTLTIGSGAAVTNESGMVAADLGSNGTVAVTGGGSTWTNTGTLNVGSSGTGIMTVSAGGQVSSLTSTLGGLVGSSGTATITGSGSLWTVDGFLDVALQGDGILNISSGGMVVTQAATLGFAAEGTGQLNLNGDAGSRGVLQTGQLSRLSGAGTVSINGGILRLTGNQASLLSGFTAGEVMLGANGGFIDTNGFTVASDASLGGAGRLTKQGAGSLTLTGAHTYTGGTTISQGHLRLDGGSISHSASSAIIGNTAAQSGELTIENGGGLHSMFGLIGSASGSSGTTTVTGGGSAWTVLGFLEVGSSGQGALTVGAGGAVSAPTTTLGFNADGAGQLNLNGTAGNRGVLETGQLNRGAGAGAVSFNGGVVRLTGNQANLFSGFGAGDITLGANGGFIDTNGFAVVSAASVAGSGRLTKQGDGTLTLTGTHTHTGGTTVSRGQLRLDGGSIGHSSDSAIVGDTAALSGELTIENGGSLESSSGYLGLASGSTGTATVTGPGSAWTNSGTLRVGDSGTGHLVIESGAGVTNSIGVIGMHAGSNGTATVSGADSTWANSDTLRVGEAGTGSMTVSSGGVVTSEYALLGSVAGATGVATVTGPASAWTNSGILRVGESGTGHLVVESGASVTNTSGAIAHNAGSSGTVAITGSGSSWTNTGSLQIGRAGTGSLAVSNGGVVTSEFGVVGNVAGSSGTATVTGAGSSWTHGGLLYVGENGAGTLAVLNGGTVSSGDNVQIGASSGSVGTATVDGINSTWTSTGTLRVGEGGSGSMTVSGGGVVTNANSLLGSVAGATGTVAVTGGGSSWMLADFLYVGYGGSGNLSASEGGLVAGSFAVLGAAAGGAGVATVSGAGSSWAQVDLLYVGENGVGTLSVLSGGSVGTGGEARIGAFAGSSGTVTVSGAGSTWSSTGGMLVGSSGQGALTVGAGGAVTAPTTTLGFNADGAGQLNLNGTAGNRGVLQTGQLNRGSGAATVSMNGGILRLSGDQPNLFAGFGAGEISLGANGGFIDSNGFAAASGTAIGGTGRLTKQGGGTLTLTGAHTYTGGTTISQGHLRLDGGSINHSAGSAIIGNTAAQSGELTIENGGGLHSIFGLIGSASGSNGTTTVTGGGSAWTVIGFLDVGSAGEGSLLVASGGIVTSNTGFVAENVGSSGMATITGSGSAWNTNGFIEVGSRGAGVLSVIDGGTMGTGGEARIGVVAGSSGTATVSGAGSIWSSTGGMLVGSSGQGALTVGAGGAVTAPTTTLGFNADGAGQLNLNGTAGNRGVLQTGQLNRGSGAATVSMNGGILRLSGDQPNLFAGFGAGEISLGANGGFIDSNGFAAASGTAIGGTGRLTKQGGGTLTLTGAHTYTGGTTISQGHLRLDGGSISHSAGSAIIGNTAAQSGELTIENGGGLHSIAGLIGSASGSSGTTTVTGGGSAWTVIGFLDVGSGGEGSLLVASGGSVTSNTGFVAENVGSSGMATITGSGSAWNTNGFIEVGSRGAGVLSVLDGGTMGTGGEARIGLVAGSSGTATVSGAGSIWSSTGGMLVGSSGQGALMVGAGGTVTAPTTTLGFNADGSGQLNLNGTAGNRGALQTGQLNRGSGAGTVSFDGGILRLTGNQANLFAGFGAGEVTFGANGGLIDTNGFAVESAVALGGGGGLTKLGQGTLVLSAQSTYGGGTTIAGGTLETRHIAALGSGPVSLNAGGTLAPVETLTINSLTWDGGRMGMSLGDTPSLLQISGNFNSVSMGREFVFTAGAGFATNTPYALIATGGTISGFGLNGISGNTIGGLAPSFAYNGGTLFVTFLAPVEFILGADNRSRVFADPINNTDDAPVRLIKSGSGRIILTNESFYTGGTVIEDGTLQLGRGRQAGGIVGEVENNGTLGFANRDDHTFGGQISGTGMVVQLGRGALTLAAANTHSGGTLLRKGGLNLADAGALGSGPFTIAARTMLDNTSGAPMTLAGGIGHFWNGNFTFAGTDDLNLGTGAIVIKGRRMVNVAAGTLTAGGEISGAKRNAGLVKAGQGTLVLAADNTYGGPTIIRAGTLQIGDGGSAGTPGGGNITNHGVLAFHRGDAIEVANRIAGRGEVRQDGDGALTLTGKNVHRGGTVVNAGTLLVGGSQALGRGDVTLNNGTLAAADGQTQINIHGDLLWHGNAFIALTLTPNADSQLVALRGSVRLLGDAPLTFAFNPVGLTGDHIFLVMTAAKGFGNLTADDFAFVSDDAGLEGVFRIEGNNLFFDDDYVPGGAAFEQSSFSGFSAIPEPSTWALLVLGAAALLRLRAGKSGRIKKKNYPVC